MYTKVGRLTSRPGSWGLRARLLTPMLGFALASVVLLSAAEYGAVSVERGQLLPVVGLILLANIGMSALVLTRELTSPLHSMAGAALQMLEGNYERRLAPSPIRELNDLGEMVNRLVEQVQVQVSELVSQAFYDPLTNLPNRVLFTDRLNQALARSQRSRKLVAILFLDLDNFKLINDSLGHQSGDELLLHVAERLSACVRTQDTAARLGGDEFIVLLEGMDDEKEALGVVDRLSESFRAPFPLARQEVFTSASIGVAISIGGQGNCEDLLRDADLAMYRAKLRGKGHVVVFDRAMNSEAVQRLKLENDLRRAVDRREFRLCYQPIVHLESGEIRDVEALVRWDHPTRGLVSPAEFISVAEETGLILPIGYWVLEEACRQMRAWQLEQPNDPPMAVSVNLSGKQLQHPALVDEVAEVLCRTGLDATSLKLEITESVMMQDAESTVARLRELKALGIRIAIDDFGTGYSSLAYLRRFPIDVLKIDRSFVDHVSQDEESSAIVSTIISLAKILDLHVIGEGIETTEQMAALRTLGCERGQGYYIARPLDSEAMSRMLAETSGAAA